MATEQLGNVYVFDSALIPIKDLQSEHNPSLGTPGEGCYGLYGGRMKADLEERISSYGKSGSQQFDGTILRFESLEIMRDKKRILRLGDMKYSTYQSLKSRLDSEPDHQHTLTQAVNIIVFVETVDGNLILGHRTGAHMGDKYLPPAGFSDHKGRIAPVFFTELSVLEVKEELGIRLSKSQVMYAGLSAGDDSRNTTVITYARSNFSSEEIEEHFQKLNNELLAKGKKLEHLHLIHVPTDLTSITSFLCNNYSGVLNPIRGIVFEEGTCVQGPEEIIGKRYSQIGNGIGGFLCLAYKIFSPEQYLILIRQIENSGIVEEVEHVDINTKLKGDY